MSISTKQGVSQLIGTLPLSTKKTCRRSRRLGFGDLPFCSPKPTRAVGPPPFLPTTRPFQGPLAIPCRLGESVAATNERGTSRTPHRARTRGLRRRLGPQPDAVRGEACDLKRITPHDAAAFGTAHPPRASAGRASSGWEPYSAVGGGCQRPLR